MAQVLQHQQSPSHFPSPQSSPAPTTTRINDGSHQQHSLLIAPPQQQEDILQEEQQEQESVDNTTGVERDQGLSLLALLVAALRKSLISCTTTSIDTKELLSMEIGWPSNVRHVAHVTFDRFNGFLGLPAEFEPEVPRRPPSASANVFGVSTESMQLSFDSRGNTVPTILLLMQRRLYEQGGLQAEGIFRINAENSHEESVREQLNRGVVPEEVDVHCLAGLIKAWFRELPAGVLDSLSPEEVMQSQSEEECVRLVRLLPPTEADLLDWAVNLMADVAQLEHINKMNARNVAMVFAPNMTKMADPLTALMYAVQVMNFLKTLIIKTLREREDSVLDTAPASRPGPFDESGHSSSLEPIIEVCENHEAEEVFVMKEPNIESPPQSAEDRSTVENGAQSFLSAIKYIFPRRNQALVDDRPREVESHVTTSSTGHQQGGILSLNEEIQTSISVCKSKIEQSNNSFLMNGSKKLYEQLQVAAPLEKGKGIGIITRINSKTELVEAWR